jgi:hypothetical protein
LVWRLWPSGMWYCFVWWPLTHVFDEDRGSSSFLWNIGNSLSNYMALHPRLNIVHVISVLIICHTMPHCYSQPNPMYYGSYIVSCTSMGPGNCMVILLIVFSSSTWCRTWSKWTVDSSRLKLRKTFIKVWEFCMWVCVHYFFEYCFVIYCTTFFW